jgi:hypothetical protein
MTTQAPFFLKHSYGSIMASARRAPADGVDMLAQDLEFLLNLLNGAAPSGSSLAGIVTSVTSTTGAIVVVTTLGAVSLSAFAAAVAAISMGGFQINNVEDPTHPQDAATKAYVDAQTGGGVTYPIAVSKGGTGATTAEGALHNLGTGTPVFGEILSPVIGQPTEFTFANTPLVNGSGYIMGAGYIGSARVFDPDDFTISANVATFSAVPAVTPRFDYIY